MFSGLSNFFKKILPKRLFYRALLIVAIPILVLQLVITIVFFLSDTSIEISLMTLYQQNKLGGLISIASLNNLPIFFLALRKNKMPFAKGLVTLSIAMVLVITYLKINAS